MNYNKNGFCTAQKHSDCENFMPVHDLDFCAYYGWGNTCDCAQEAEDIFEKYIQKLEHEAQKACADWRFFRYWRISDEIRRLKRIQRLCADPVDKIADILDCRSSYDSATSGIHNRSFPPTIWIHKIRCEKESGQRRNNRRSSCEKPEGVV